MRIVGAADEDAVVAAFLAAESASPRFADRIAQLRARGLEGRELLEEHRQWGRDVGLFDGFPADVAWARAMLTREEVLDIRFIDWDWWLTLSGGTRRPRVAAARIRAGLIAGFGAESHEPLARNAARNPPLVAVRRDRPRRSSSSRATGA